MSNTRQPNITFSYGASSDNHIPVSTNPLTPAMYSVDPITEDSIMSIMDGMLRSYQEAHIDVKGLSFVLSNNNEFAFRNACCKYVPNVKFLDEKSRGKCRYKGLPVVALTAMPDDKIFLMEYKNVVSATREPGYYWVKTIEGWQAALWVVDEGRNEQYFLLAGNPVDHESEYFTEINETRIPPPDEQ